LIVVLDLPSRPCRFDSDPTPIEQNSVPTLGSDAERSGRSLDKMKISDKGLALVG
jgi:hypothetical protein